MINLTDLLTGGGTISLHENMCGGKGLVLKIASTQTTIDMGVLILQAENGIRPSIGLHGHPDGISECYTILAGTARINNVEIEPGGFMLCQVGGKHSLEPTSDLVIVQYQKMRDQDTIV